MTVALTILKAIGWRGLLLIGALAALSAWHLHGISAAKESGRVEVRQQWAEAQRRADLKQIAKVEAQQKQINAADAALVTTMAAHVGQVAGLEAALADERKRKNATPNATGKSTCPAISDGVRNVLNTIGATKP
ncbi:secretion protein HylD [Agrobacterium vitis]